MFMPISPQNPNAIKINLVTKENLASFDKAELFESLKFKGNYKQIVFLPESKQIFVGVSLDSSNKVFDPFFKVDFFNLGAVITNSLAKTKITQIQLEHVDAATEFNSKNLQDLVLGMMQASWNFDTYLDTKKTKTKQLEISLNSSFDGLLDPNKIAEIEIFNTNLNLVRTLVESIPEDVNPESMMKLIQENLGNRSNLKLELWDAQKLQENKLNSVMFVGRASRYQPTLVHATLTPKGEIKHKICLVGKGVTYDSGGLDIKTEGHMKTMKTDMAGSATMFGIIKTLAEIGLENTEIHWISAFAENMVSGNSYKADDVITSYSGQTIEILNTDAEGRLLLADCLSLATTFNPDYIIDAATLTGACVVALSERYTALMSNDKQFSDNLFSHFVQTGEHAAQVILPQDLKEEVAGTISDLINTSKVGRQAGHITAGLFLGHFVDQKLFRNPDIKLENPKEFSWVHLDIAGSAFNNKKNSIEYNGATGQSLRSIVSWVRGVDG
jgi:leucyl aminopeptidase